MSLMNLNSGRAHNNKNSRRTKAIPAVATHMAGIIVALALISGLVLVSGSYYQPAIAQQQNMTGTTGTATGGSSTGGGGSTPSSSACTPTETGVGGGTQSNMTASPTNSSPSASSLTGGTTTGGGSTANS